MKAINAVGSEQEVPLQASTQELNHGVSYSVRSKIQASTNRSQNILYEPRSNREHCFKCQVYVSR